MKRYLKFLSLGLLAFIAFSRGSCTDEDLSTISQQVPITKDVVLTGIGNTIEQSGTANLSESSFYTQNQSKIKKIAFVKISYKTTSVDPADLAGTLSVTFKKADQTELFTVNVAGNHPSDYLTNPYELQITQDQLALLNNDIAAQTNKSITASVKFETSTLGTKTIAAQIFLVFQMDYQP